MVYAASCALKLGFYGPRIYFFIDSTCFYSPARISLKSILNVLECVFLPAAQFLDYTFKLNIN